MAIGGTVIAEMWATFLGFISDVAATFRELNITTGSRNTFEFTLHRTRVNQTALEFGPCERIPKPGLDSSARPLGACKSYIGDALVYA